MRPLVSLGRRRYTAVELRPPSTPSLPLYLSRATKPDRLTQPNDGEGWYAWVRSCGYEGLGRGREGVFVLLSGDPRLGLCFWGGMGEEGTKSPKGSV